MDKRTLVMAERLGPEIPIKARTIPMGLPGVNRRDLPGYLLADGTALMESERDSSGNYVGGAGIGGMYLRTPCRYAPVKNESGEIRAFREVLAGPVRARKRGEPER